MWGTVTELSGRRPLVVPSDLPVSIGVPVWIDWLVLTALAVCVDRWVLPALAVCADRRVVTAVPVLTEGAEGRVAG